MEYKVRALNAEDIFPAVNIISKIGISQFKKVFEGASLKVLISNAKEKMSESNEETIGSKSEEPSVSQNNEAYVAEVGMSIAFDIVEIILKNFGNCKEEIFNFLSSLTSIEVENLKAAPPADVANMLIDIFEQKEFKDFLKVVLKFVK